VSWTCNRALKVASASRYCRRFTAVPDLATLPRALLELGARAVLYVDNDPMLKTLEPHAAELGRRLALVDPLGDALRLTDKSWQLVAPMPRPRRMGAVRAGRSCAVAQVAAPARLFGVYTKILQASSGRPVTRRA
jgi:hypothetical protein